MDDMMHDAQKKTTNTSIRGTTRGRYTPNPQLYLMKSSMHEEKLFWVSNMKISRTSENLHFRVTKKDLGLPFHFHVLNLFKSWSNLGFDQNSNGHKIKKIDK
jgi:hypothetical protein